MNQINANVYNIVFGYEGLSHLNSYIRENNSNFSKIFILVDNNTYECCLPVFAAALPDLVDFEIIEVEAGEEAKNLHTCEQIWEALTEGGADRKTLLINLGGGVITDMGAFCASCFKRGIKFINIPTTLLSQVDASVGGKTGVDLGNLKNQIGVFANPEMVVVFTGFLQTLDGRQLVSGLAEMFKHGLIYDHKHWEALISADELTIENLEPLIHQSVSIKNEVVNQDWKESGLRKILNFGHTIGHAIETHFLNDPKRESLTHGEAIAVGMVCEAYLSHEVYKLDLEFVKQFKQFMNDMFGSITWEDSDEAQFMTLMKHDKKNSAEKINFSLLEEIGKCRYDDFLEEESIRKALNFYRN